MRRDGERLRDALAAIAAINRHWPIERDRYDGDEVLRFFFLKQIEIIGEVVFKLSSETKAAFPLVPWKKVAGIRHILVHDYFNIDWDILWDVLINHVELLRTQLEEILAQFP